MYFYHTDLTFDEHLLKNSPEKTINNKLISVPLLIITVWSFNETEHIGIWQIICWLCFKWLLSFNHSGVENQIEEANKNVTLYNN